MTTMIKLFQASSRSAFLMLLLVLSCTAQAAAVLEITEHGKPGEKKSVPLNSTEPQLFNIEFFSGWSHCEVAAGVNASNRQSYAWLRCFSQEDVQIALACTGNERQSVVLGHKEDTPENNRKRGSLTLVCKSD